MPDEPTLPEKPSRVLNSDIYDLMYNASVNTDRRFQALQTHIDTRFGCLQEDVRQLRQATGFQADDFESRVDKLERGWSVGAAFLGGGWKVVLSISIGVTCIANADKIALLADHIVRLVC